MRALAYRNAPSAPVSSEPLPTATLFNGYVAASVVFALSELGFFELVGQRPISVAGAAAALGVPRGRLEVLCRVLVGVGVLAPMPRGRRYALTPVGRSVVQHVGYFTWALGGYGEMLANLHHLATGEKVFGEDVRRDERAIARGVGQATPPIVWAALPAVLEGCRFRSVVDLGCGSGRFLIRLCQTYPAVRAVGVDVSANACALARQNATAAGLQQRIDIVQADVCELLADPGHPAADRIRDADLVTSFFMLHDLLAASQDGKRHLAQLAGVLRPTASFIFCESMKTESLDEFGRQPLFTFAYEVVHEFMGQRLFSKKHCDRVFAACGWKVERCVPLATPATWLYRARPVRVPEKSDDATAA